MRKSSCLIEKDIRMRGFIDVNRSRGRQRRRWIEDISDWSGLNINTAVPVTEDRQRRRNVLITASWRLFQNVKRPHLVFPLPSLLLFARSLPSVPSISSLSLPPPFSSVLPSPATKRPLKSSWGLMQRYKLP